LFALSVWLLAIGTWQLAVGTWHLALKLQAQSPCHSEPRSGEESAFLSSTSVAAACLSPLRGWLVCRFDPWLAPWALLLRRFAAEHFQFLFSS